MIVPLVLGATGLTSAFVSPVSALAQAEAADSPARTAQRNNLSIGIGNCPHQKPEPKPPEPQKPGTQGAVSSFFPPTPVAVAASIAPIVAGAAIESTVDYLSQERAFTSRGVATLNPQENQDLFTNRKCLYAYLYTLDLWRYFNPGQQQPPARGVLPLMIDPKFSSSSSTPVLSDPAVIREISARRLTNFLMVVSFEPAGVDTVKVGKPDEGQVEYRFHRPYFWATIYPSFVDTNCPALRNCAKRDVVLQLILKFPTAPDPSKTETRASVFSKAYEGARSESVGAALTQRYGQWFAVNTSIPILTNLELTLVESSKPGAFVKALGASLKENKSSVIQVIVPQQ